MVNSKQLCRVMIGQWFTVGVSLRITYDVIYLSSGGQSQHNIVERLKEMMQKIVLRCWPSENANQARLQLELHPSHADLFFFRVGFAQPPKSWYDMHSMPWCSARNPSFHLRNELFFTCIPRLLSLNMAALCYCWKMCTYREMMWQ